MLPDRGARSRLALLGQTALPVLIPVSAVVFMWGENADVVRVRDVVAPFATAVGITVAVQVVLSLLTRQLVRPAVTVALGAIGVLTFGYQLDAAGTMMAIDEDQLRWWLFAGNVIVMLLAALVVWRSSARIERVATAGAVVAAIFILLSLPKVATGLRVSEPAAAPDRAAVEAGTHSPDIYYLILDGYARDDVLAEVFGYSNEPFLQWLDDRGFYVARDSLANYTRTHLSLASSLNMTYLDDLPPNLTPDAGKELTRLIEEPLAVTKLQDLGYRYVHFDTIWWGTADAPLADISFGTGLGSEFETVLFDTTLPGRVLPLPTWQELHLRTLSHLPEVADIEGPTITLAHVLLPHPPFVFDESGRQIKRDVALGGSWGDRDAYIAQLRFVNGWLMSTIEAVLARSSQEPIIIVQSDHGPWSTGESESQLSRWERTAILNAYLVPSEVRTELYPSISPANSFRLLLEVLFGTPMPLLPDRAMFSPSDTDPRIDVTDQLRGR